MRVDTPSCMKFHRVSSAVQLVRLPYDIKRAIALAAEMEMPALEPYAMELRTAVYRGRQ